MELKPITISFKSIPDEIALYQIITSHSSKGAFIKDVLIETLIKKDDRAKENQNKNTSILNDELSEILDI